MSAALERRLAELVPAEALGRWDRGPVPPVPCVAPTEEEQFRAVLRLATREGLRVWPLGLGSKVGWIRRPERVDLVLSTRGYRGVTSYEPADGTVTARAGTPMADLAAVVGEGGHHLTPAVPLPDASTLGGVVAAGQSGDDRLRYGALRENLLGTRFVLADGTVAKSGGQLVKNVTGYDVHRVLCGSFGSLGVVLEASLRLYPLPDQRAVFLARTESRGEALDLAAEIRRAPVRPVTLLVHDLDPANGRRPWTVLAVLAGHGAVVSDEIGTLAALRECERDNFTLSPMPLGASPVADAAPRALAASRSARSSASIARGHEVESLTRPIRDLERSGDHWPALSLEVRPSLLKAVLVDVVRAAGETGFGVRFLLHPGIARAVVWLLPDPADAEDADPMAPDRVADLDERLSRLPVVARWRDLPPGAAAVVQPRGRPGAGLPTMRALRAALDPAGVLAPRLFDAEA